MSKILLGIVSFTLLSLSGCATNSKSQSTNVPVVYQGESKVVIYRESGNNKMICPRFHGQFKRLI